MAATGQGQIALGQPGAKVKLRLSQNFILASFFPPAVNRTPARALF
jgi:hypothetical protein